LHVAFREPPASIKDGVGSYALDSICDKEPPTALLLLNDLRVRSFKFMRYRMSEYDDRVPTHAMQPNWGDSTALPGNIIGRA
jgi:hypothetical protein